MNRSRLARCGAGALMSAALLISPVALPAKIDLVTLPARDTTQLTVYMDADLTLVRETRRLTFNEGRNEIQFSWGGTLIDPTSVQIRMANNARGYRILDSRHPANTRNTIIWTIDAPAEGQADVEITYFASGVSWYADYSVIANEDETEFRLEPHFTLQNRSGEDFQAAETRLVVGQVNLVETIADLARRGMIDKSEVDRFARRAMEPLAASAAAPEAAFLMADGFADMRTEAAEILRAAVSEYHLYSIDGKEDLRDGWGKRLPNPVVRDIPLEVSYEYNPNKYGHQMVKFYKFRNDEDHSLGKDPIPAGSWYVYSDDGRDGLQFQGATSHAYAPIGEEVELQLGADGTVVFEQRTMRERRENLRFDPFGNIASYEQVQEIEYEVRNSRTSTVPVKLTIPFGGEWEITETSADYNQLDLNTVEWELDVPAGEKEIVSITLLTRVRLLDPGNGTPPPQPLQPRPTRNQPAQIAPMIQNLD